MKIRNLSFFSNIILSKTPEAKAEIAGGPLAPNIKVRLIFIRYITAR